MAQGRTTHRHRGALDWRLLSLSPTTLTVALVVLAGADWGTRLAGDTLFPGGPLDELAHVLTTLLVFWALGSRARERFMLPALIASVVIDVDHIPDRFGVEWFTVGTPRPYTHSLLLILVVVALAVAWSRRRDVLLAVAIGLAIHFFRDMGEGDSGVALLWPFTDHAFQYSHGVYVAVMVAFVLIDTGLCVQRRPSSDRASSWPPHRARLKRLEKS
ncbi:MAG: metal-dependent hydrolase [Solirubrobacterales bacterium]|nr:metal-dependent hydrolase [Solirubrobacterales bacterium]